MLLKNNYLPEAIERCTFTTTTIEASKDENQAIIKFFSKNEFIKKFNSLCKEIEFENCNYETITEEQLDNFLIDKK